MVVVYLLKFSGIHSNLIVCCGIGVNHKSGAIYQLVLTKQLKIEHFSVWMEVMGWRSTAAIGT